MLSLTAVHLSDRDLVPTPLAALGDSHGLTPDQLRMYHRFYGLQGVTCHPGDLGPMLAQVLARAVASLPPAQRVRGQLFYCKTQTHNTLADRHWLRALADAQGLAGWEASAVTMTSCASALTLLHFAGLADTREPLIVLTGEKAFHPSVSRLPVGLLAEVPAAALFNSAAGGWQVRGTTVRHLPQFYQNPDAMAAEDRRALQGCYVDGLRAFLHDSLAHYAPHLRDDFTFLPHNLNQPVTTQLIRHFGWQSRSFQGDVAQIGHAYCSDIFVNLRAFEAAGPTASDQLLVLAAGTGVTFATCLLDRTPTDPKTGHCT